jgi:hypothetical protein
MQEGLFNISMGVDRTITEIHKPKALFSLKMFYKKYDLIIMDFFMFTASLKNRPIHLKKHICKKSTFFRKSALR